MVKVKNISTGEVAHVKNVNIDSDGTLVADVWAPKKSNKFYTIYPMMVRTGETRTSDFKGSDVECDVLRLAEGWELDTTRKARQPKAQQVQDVQVRTSSSTTDDDMQLALGIIKMLKSGQTANIDEAQVSAIASKIVDDKIAKIKSNEVVHKIQIADKPQMNEVKNPHPLLPKILTLVANDRVIGRFPWLFGPAGSGKSTIAKQVAEALGLPFYSVSSLQQKYEMEGYSDAAGRLVETTFYKAFKNGGVFCFDEASTSPAEVQIAFNTAIAQLIYNFPVDGMVNAHPDFHIIAADNTAGRGGSNRYHARFELDASTLDRYNFIEVDYTDEHDMNMACGDKDLVDFIKSVRVALNDANLTYTATPRASKAIKAMQACGIDDKEALFIGLCSGWNKQDIRTVGARLYGDNKYFKLFKQIAK